MTINMFVSTTYHRLLADICSSTGVSLDAPNDITYDWAYIDGPKLDKILLMFLENGGSEPTFPEWLAPLWQKFRESDSPALLGSIRQILLFCYKTEQQPTHEQLRQAQEGFEEAETGVACWSDWFNDRHSSFTARRARRIVGSIIYRINWYEITPFHGPGGVFPSRLPRDKSRFVTLYTSIINKYPFDQFYCGIPSFWDTVLATESWLPLEETSVIVAKLIAVPKDSRGPRLICVHPCESIWIQQGQRLLLERAITRHPLTRGKVNFTDQTVNGVLALSSSKNREFCSLDLKEASDRVSSSLVKFLFGDFAYDWISCSRATHVKLLDGRVLELKKWAPMGNALCFPVESLVFFSLVVAGILNHYGIDCTDVYVFGDDILFPSEYRQGVITTLSEFGLIPNSNKTFSKGFFRESCGVDAYKGIDVTPIRLKKPSIDSLEDATSICDLALRARLRGLASCSAFLYKEVRRYLIGYGISMPISNNKTCGGFFEYQDIPFTELILRSPDVRYLKSWQRWTARKWSVTGQQHVVEYGDWYHLQDSLLRLERKFSSTESHGDSPSDRATEYAIPRRTQLVRGWLDYNL